MARHFATGSPHDFCRGTLTAALVGRLKEGEQMLMARTGAHVGLVSSNGGFDKWGYRYPKMDGL